MAATAAPQTQALPEGRTTLRGEVRLAVGHLGVQTVRGSLGGLEGELEVRDGRVRGTAAVDAASFATGTPPRDRHVRGFLLRAARHPRIELRVDAPLAAVVPGELHLRGRVVRVGVELEPRPGGLRARLLLDRHAAGLRWPGLVDRAVGRHVDVVVDAVLS